MPEKTRPWYFNGFSDKAAFAGLSRVSPSSRDIFELAWSELMHFIFPRDLLHKILSEHNCLYPNDWLLSPKEQDIRQPHNSEQRVYQIWIQQCPKAWEQNVSFIHFIYVFHIDRSRCLPGSVQLEHQFLLQMHDARGLKTDGFQPYLIEIWHRCCWLSSTSHRKKGRIYSNVAGSDVRKHPKPSY